MPVTIGAHAEVTDRVARPLAALGRLPLVAALARDPDAPPQSEMGNSARQARNALRALSLTDEARQLGGGPLLLVAATRDAGWVVTVGAWQLRGAGAGPVLPLVLSSGR